MKIMRNYEYILDEILEDCKTVAIKAGAEIMKIYNSGEYSVKEKSDNTPVTEADIRANDIILKYLMPKYPEAGFLAEESSDNLLRREKEWCFVIDPLDGTKEFVNRTDEFTVNIALVRNQKPVLGVIYVPAINELYFAVKGKGAFHSYKREDSEKAIEKINVSRRTENIRAAVSRSNSPPDIKERMSKYGVNNIIYAGSSLKGCLIAAGKIEIYYRQGLTSEWDTAAMQCIVEEAGGILRQLDGTPMLYNRENTLNEKGFYIINSEKNKLNLKE